jgi:hypothetical protein
MKKVLVMTSHPESGFRRDRRMFARADGSPDAGRRGQTAESGGVPGGERLGAVLLGLSAIGLPLGWLALRRLGRWGGLLVEAGCGVLFARDLAMTATGAPARLRPLPRILLLLETVTSGTAGLAGLWGWVRQPFLSPVADTVGNTPLSGSARGKPVQRQARLGAPWLARSARLPPQPPPPCTPHARRSTSAPVTASVIVHRHPAGPTEIEKGDG